MLSFPWDTSTTAQPLQKVQCVQVQTDVSNEADAEPEQHGP